MTVEGEQNVSGPLRIVSDLHLAHSASMIEDVSQLRPLLEGATQVAFNGDTCEQLYAAWREKSEQMKEELVALCEELGITPIFLMGNHDPRISRCGWVVAEEGRVLVTHGDLILENPSPWSREYLERKEMVDEVIRCRGEGDGSLRYRWETLQLINAQLIPEEEQLEGKGFVGRVLDALRPPERLFQIVRIWMRLGSHAQSFVEQFAPECRALIFGHFHRPCVVERGGRLFCNTGDYVSQARPFVVDIVDGEIAVHRVRGGREFRLGEMVKRYYL